MTKNGYVRTQCEPGTNSCSLMCTNPKSNNAVEFMTPYTIWTALFFAVPDLSCSGSVSKTILGLPFQNSVNSNCPTMSVSSIGSAEFWSINFHIFTQIFEIEFKINVIDQKSLNFRLWGVTCLTHSFLDVQIIWDNIQFYKQQHHINFWLVEKA